VLQRLRRSLDGRVHEVYEERRVGILVRARSVPETYEAKVQLLP
jgi:hypothetical protein